VTILDKDDRLRPEMSAKVTFLEREGGTPSAPARTVVTVPQEAVVRRGDRSVVFEVKDGRAQQREVKTAAVREGHVEIASGLAGGETVVLRPGEALQDGARVSVAR
jgi:HlyD family secretion protein